jgi:PHB de-polymerase C-terminus
MNLGRRVKSHVEWFEEFAAGKRSKAQAKKEFYEEYFAVLDLSVAFYLQTVRFVFQEHRLARGTLKWRGRNVDPPGIRRTALFTVEGKWMISAPWVRPWRLRIYVSMLSLTKGGMTCKQAQATSGYLTAGVGKPKSTRFCAT